MLLNVVKRNGDVVLHPIQVGSTVVGLRFLSLVIESTEELHQLLSPKGQEWAKRNLCHAFRKVE